MLSDIARLLKFGIVGLVSNIVVYLMYLIITSQGVEHKKAMSILYFVSVMITFLLNRNWTFKSYSNAHKSFLLYIFSYLVGYVINLLSLFVLVDLAGFDHRLVQGCMVLVIAAFLYTAQVKFVFKET